MPAAPAAQTVVPGADNRAAPPSLAPIGKPGAGDAMDGDSSGSPSGVTTPLPPPFFTSPFNAYPAHNLAASTKEVNIAGPSRPTPTYAAAVSGSPSPAVLTAHGGADIRASLWNTAKPTVNKAVDEMSAEEKMAAALELSKLANATRTAMFGNLLHRLSVGELSESDVVIKADAARKRAAKDANRVRVKLEGSITSRTAVIALTKQLQYRPADAAFDVRKGVLYASLAAPEHVEKLARDGLVIPVGPKGQPGARLKVESAAAQDSKYIVYGVELSEAEVTLALAKFGCKARIKSVELATEKAFVPATCPGKGPLHFATGMVITFEGTVEMEDRKIVVGNESYEFCCATKCPRCGSDTHGLEDCVRPPPVPALDGPIITFAASGTPETSARPGMSGSAAEASGAGPSRANPVRQNAKRPWTVVAGSGARDALAPPQGRVSTIRYRGVGPRNPPERLSRSKKVRSVPGPHEKADSPGDVASVNMQELEALVARAQALDKEGMMPGEPVDEKEGTGRPTAPADKGVSLKMGPTGEGMADAQEAPGVGLSAPVDVDPPEDCIFSCISSSSKGEGPACVSPDTVMDLEETPLQGCQGGSELDTGAGDDNPLAGEPPRRC